MSTSASWMKLCSALALTATFSLADKLSLAQLMNLQTEMADNLELDHHDALAGEAMHHTDHRYTNEQHHYEESELNELEWETITEVSGNLRCKEGFTKVGCCKCVSDTGVTAKHETMPEIKAMPLAYHGMEPAGATAKPQMPTEMKANEPNLAGWFTKSSSDSEDKSKSSQAAKKDEKSSDDRETQKERDEQEWSSSYRHQAWPPLQVQEDDYQSDISHLQKRKFTMSTPEEQARGHHEIKQSDQQKKSSDQKKGTDGKKQKDEDKKGKITEDDDEKKQSEQQRDEEQAAKCPEGFTYESHKNNHQYPMIVEACRMPMSYELVTGDSELPLGGHHHSHHDTDSHYSYGRWLDKCAENFVRNGCCTCTPHCPDSMILHEWPATSHKSSDFVCLIYAGNEY